MSKIVGIDEIIEQRKLREKKLKLCGSVQKYNEFSEKWNAACKRIRMQK